jgi:hypothetical protein
MAEAQSEALNPLVAVVNGNPKLAAVLFILG